MLTTKSIEESPWTPSGIQVDDGGMTYPDWDIGHSLSLPFISGGAFEKHTTTTIAHEFKG